MVYHGACPSYSTIINAAKDWDIERCSRDHDETGGIASRGNRCWNESDSGTVGQFDAAIARHQKGQGRSRWSLVHLLPCKKTYQGYLPDVSELFSFKSPQSVEWCWCTMVSHLSSLWASTWELWLHAEDGYQGIKFVLYILSVSWTWRQKLSCLWFAPGKDVWFIFCERKGPPDSVSAATSGTTSIIGSI